MSEKTGIIFIENYVAGGADRVAWLLSQHLPFKQLTIMVNSRNDYRILCPSGLANHVKIDRYRLLTIAEISCAVNSIKIPWLRSLLRVLAFSLRYPLILFSFIYFYIRIARIRPNIFLANNGGYPGGFYCRSATIAASLLPNIQNFHVVHGMAEPARGLSIPFEKCIDYLLDHRSRVLTVSFATAVRLATVRFFRQNIDVVYNGIPDIQRIKKESNVLASSKLRVLHVGYFDFNKNQKLLLEAMGQLKKNNINNIEIMFIGVDIGDGCLDQCKALSKELGIDDNVEFSDFVFDIEACYDEADVFVLCSHKEGMPMSVLEAMRSGVPVVATNVGGLSELIKDGQNGFLVASDDYLALAEKLAMLEASLELRASLGRAARASFEDKFTIQTMIGKYNSILNLTHRTSVL